MLERQRRAAPVGVLLWPALLGLIGAAAVAIASPRITADPVRWWFQPRLGLAARPLLYAGMVALVAAWLIVGRRGGGSVAHRRLALIAGAWSLPLLLAPPLFSHDIYSYLAQGTIAHLGLNPYASPPTVLAHLGHAKVLRTVSPFWRRTTSPYGPIFIAVVREVVGITGSNVVVGAILVRLIDFLGLVLLAELVPRLATRLGASPARAAWLVVLNPLVLLQLVAPGHNDLLMAGVMVCGVVLALDGRPLIGFSLCVLAGMIKLPALAAAGFIAIAWIRSREDLRARGAALARFALAAAVVLALVSWLSGFGTEWLSSSVFSTPNRVHLAITPSTALGWTVMHLARGLGLRLSLRHLESGLSLAALVIAGLVALDRARRVQLRTLPRDVGIVLIAFALGGPAAWPWYFVWAIVLLAACPPSSLSLALAAGSIVGSFVVKPDGILVLPVQSSPGAVALYAACAVYLWRIYSRHPERMAPAAA